MICQYSLCRRHHRACVLSEFFSSVSHIKEQGSAHDGKQDIIHCQRRKPHGSIKNSRKHFYARIQEIDEKSLIQSSLCPKRVLPQILTNQWDSHCLPDKRMFFYAMADETDDTSNSCYRNYERICRQKIRNICNYRAHIFSSQRINHKPVSWN